MKIENKSINKRVGEIVFGSVFRHGQLFYIMTKSQIGNKLQALDIESGALFDFGYNEVVTPVEAVVTIL